MFKNQITFIVLQGHIFMYAYKGSTNRRLVQDLPRLEVQGQAGFDYKLMDV